MQGEAFDIVRLSSALPRLLSTRLSAHSSACLILSRWRLSVHIFRLGLLELVQVVCREGRVRRHVIGSTARRGIGISRLPVRVIGILLEAFSLWLQMLLHRASKFVRLILGSESTMKSVALVLNFRWPFVLVGAAHVEVVEEIIEIIEAASFHVFEHVFELVEVQMCHLLGILFLVLRWYRCARRL